MNEFTTVDDFQQAVLIAEQQQLSQWLPNIFGYYLLALSDTLTTEDLSASKIHKRFVAKPQSSQYAQLVAKSTELPFADNSIDCLIIHHQLEHLNDPVCTLAEAERVLISHGQLIIIGFNPNSLLSLWQRFTKTQYLRAKHSYSLPTLTTLLSNSQFVIEESHYFFHQLPWRTWPLLKTLCTQLLPGRGAIYALRIRKKNPCVIPLHLSAHLQLQTRNVTANQ